MLVTLGTAYLEFSALFTAQVAADFRRLTRVMVFANLLTPYTCASLNVAKVVALLNVNHGHTANTCR